ncbi:hypothetical protein ACK6S7_17350 [Proteus mirabilis]|uniref:hypothetical protein n=1 Tax=Proteus mirabilis TaxID=584 RepID=UPI0039B4C317
MRKVILAIVIFSFNCSAFAYGELSKKDISWLEEQKVIKDIGCEDYVDISSSGKKSGDVSVNESVFKKDRIFNKSKVVCYLTEKEGKFSVSVIEEAVIDGKKVSVSHTDGSGYVGSDYYNGWAYKCKKDAMTDEVACGMHRDDFTIEKNNNGYRIQVGYKHFPNSLSYIRINKENPIKSEDSGIYSRELSNEIISKISDEEVVTIRYTKWPNDRPIDKKINMDGFNVAKEVVGNLLVNYK